MVYESVPSSSSSNVPSTANHNQDHHQTITKISIKETNSFRGIPYSDYFHVVTDWEVLDTSRQQQTAGQDECVVSVYLNFVFFKSTWLQGTIESNTKAELMEVMDQWYESALHHMRMMLDHRSTMPSSQSMIAIQTQGTNAGVDDTMMDEDVETGIQRDPSEGGSSSAPKTPTDRQSLASSRASSDHEGGGMIFDDHDEDYEDEVEEEEEDELVP